MRLQRYIKAVIVSASTLALSGCVVFVPFIESDLPQSPTGSATSYAYEKSCAISQDPIVHFFAPQPPGAIADVKSAALRSRSAPQPRRSPRLSKRARKLSLLLRQLERGDEIVRTHAASDLGMMGSYASPAVDELGRALRFDSSKWVRRAAARSLGKIGSRQGIPALQRAVQSDRNKYVAHSAQRSLQRITRSF